MKTVLGMAASFIGILLVCGGIYGLAVCVTLSDSEPQFTERLAGWVIVALLPGSVLCWPAWKWLKHGDEE